MGKLVLYFQIYSTFGCMSVLFNTLLTPIRVWSEIVNPVSTSVAYFYYYGHVVHFTFGAMTIIQSFVVRIMISCIWKRPSPLEDEFFQLFFCLFNIMLSFLFGSLQLITKEGGFLLFRYAYLNYKK